MKWLTSYKYAPQMTSYIHIMIYFCKKIIKWVKETEELKKEKSTKDLTVTQDQKTKNKTTAKAKS